MKGLAKIVIAEDEPLAREALREALREVQWVECAGEATDGQEAVRMVNDLRPDLLFLDVRLPELSGLQVLERIRHDPAVVFTTAFESYAVAAFELGAVDYLLKPFSAVRVLQALERARTSRFDRGYPAPRRLRETMSEGAGWITRFFVTHGNEIHPVRVDRVTRFEACDDYVEVYEGAQRHLLSIPLTDLEPRLNPAQFLRVHRRCIINLDHVARMRTHDDRRLLIEMNDGSRVLASRRGTQQLRALIG